MVLNAICQVRQAADNSETTGNNYCDGVLIIHAFDKKTAQVQLKILY